MVHAPAYSAFLTAVAAVCGMHEWIARVAAEVFVFRIASVFYCFFTACYAIVRSINACFFAVAAAMGLHAEELGFSVQVNDVMGIIAARGSAGNGDYFVLNNHICVICRDNFDAGLHVAFVCE